MVAKIHAYDQVVYLLQGGGALGSYQRGVCEALLNYGIQPDWVVGTSIGAINAAIIAGNLPQNRVAKLKEFWNTISSPFPFFPVLSNDHLTSEWIKLCSALWVSSFGLSGFFQPRIAPWSFFGDTPDKISFYDTAQLRTTLLKVVDFDLINAKHTRLTLGTTQVKNGEAIRFDNFHQLITPEHIMASAALPPGFPAIKIDGEYYWDGGINSNTPFAAVMQESMPKKLLCFIVNLYSYREQIPETLVGLIKAKKEIEYMSRHNEIIKFFCEVHYLQHALKALTSSNPNNADLNYALEKIKRKGHPTTLNIIRFHYLDRPSDLWSKDYNFSHLAINEHYHFGLTDAKKALLNPSWLSTPVDELRGAVLHEF